MTKEQEAARKKYDQEAANDPPDGTAGGEGEASTDGGNQDAPQPSETSPAPAAVSSPAMSHRTATVLFLALSAVGLRVASSGKLARSWSALWGSATSGVKK